MQERINKWSLNCTEMFFLKKSFLYLDTAFMYLFTFHFSEKNNSDSRLTDVLILCHKELF